MSSQNAQSSSSRHENCSDGAFDCIICMEVLVNPRMLPCGHSFCSSPKKCLSGLLKLKSPPKCASCNGKLPASIREEDVPKNYALSSAIEALKTSGKTSGEKGPMCPQHGKKQDLYCRPCGVVICKKCWKTDHNMSKHEVVLFSSTLEPFTEVQSKLSNCKREAQKLSKLLIESAEKCSELLDEIQKAENSVKHAMCSTTPAEVNERVRGLHSKLATSTSKLKSLSTNSIKQQVDEVQSKLAETLNLPSWDQLTPVVQQRTEMDDLGSSNFNTISIDLRGERNYSSVAIDTAEETLYLAHANKIAMYKINGTEAIFNMEKDVKSTYCMCVVSDQLVIQKVEAKIGREIEIRDKESLQRKVTVPPRVDGNILRMAGYSDTLALICVKDNEYSICLYKGSNFKFVARTVLIGFNFDSIFFCNKETLVVAYFPRLLILNFNEQEITAKRYITLDVDPGGLIIDSDWITEPTFLTNPVLSPHKWYAVGKTGVGTFYWKFDGSTLEDGDTISGTVFPDFYGSTEFELGVDTPLSRSSKFLFLSKKSSNSFGDSGYLRKILSLR